MQNGNNAVIAAKNLKAILSSDMIIAGKMPVKKSETKKIRQNFNLPYHLIANWKIKNNKINDMRRILLFF